MNIASCLTIILIALIILCLIKCSSSSNYSISPTPIMVKGPTGSFDNLKYDLSCVPGPESTAGYYTKDLTPGGFCGAQTFVDNQAEYEIVDGIGGSLLDH